MIHAFDVPPVRSCDAQRNLIVLERHNKPQLARKLLERIEHASHTPGEHKAPRAVRRATPLHRVLDGPQECILHLMQRRWLYAMVHARAHMHVSISMRRWR